MLTSFEFYLSLEVLVFGIIVVVLEYLAIRRRSSHVEDILRIYAVTLIIIGTLFGITAGFGSEQIAPAMGLFGTIAGYLLGKRTSADHGREVLEGGSNAADTVQITRSTEKE
jgi:membrane associated rhomboid family serine protease